MQRHIPDIMAVNADNAGVNLVKAGNQIGNRGLARPGGPHEGNHLAGLCLQCHIGQGRHSFLVFKGHMLQGNPALDGGQVLSILLVPDGLRQVKHHEHPVYGSHGFLQAAVQTGQALHRISQVHGISQESHQGTCGHHAADNLVAPEPDNEGHGHRRQKLHRRRQEAGQLHILHGRLEVQQILILETSDFIIFTGKGLHHPDGGNALLQEGSDIRHALLDNRAVALQLAAENLHGLAHQGYHHHGQQGELPVQVKHKDNGAYQDGALRHNLNQFIHQGCLDGRHVIGDEAHGLAGLVLVEIGHGHALELAEHQLTHINDHLLPDKGHQIALPVVENAPYDEDHHHAHADDIQHGHIPLGQHLVYHILDNPGQVKIRPGSNNGADDGQDKLLQIGLDMEQQAPVIFHKIIPYLVPQPVSFPLPGQMHRGGPANHRQP